MSVSARLVPLIVLPPELGTIALTGVWIVPEGGGVVDGAVVGGGSLARVIVKGILAAL
ncbi:MAG: hypothetical protein M3433_04965 [Actinomycetota bacterium]|nr:hypothetical protein [Actinomycetota bacterium]MDQ3647921.1 hypothetical protein [Actinomycetota bacterium]